MQLKYSRSDLLFGPDILKVYNDVCYGEQRLTWRAYLYNPKTSLIADLFSTLKGFPQHICVKSPCCWEEVTTMFLETFP